MFNSILELLELKKNNWSTECAEIWQGFTICEVLEENVKEDLKSSQYT